MIEHIICEGGYSVFIKQIIILNNLKKNKILDNLKTISGYSAGAITGILYCLNIDENNFCIILKNLEFVNVEYLLSIVLKKNSINVVINDILEPFFKSKNISLNISLIDFYKMTNIELKIISFRKNIETNISEDCYFSHIIEPDLKLLDALALSISQDIDILNFKKITYKNYIYQDNLFKIPYLSKLYSNCDNNLILFLGIEKEDKFINIDNENPSLYFKKCLFYKRHYIKKNFLQNISNEILKTEIIKNEIINITQKNNSNLYYNSIYYNSIIKEINETSRLLFDKQYRIELCDVLNKEFCDYKII